MLQLRVYRLSIPLTILGMEVWAFFTVGFGTLVCLQIYQNFMPAWSSALFSFGTGFGILKVVEIIRKYFPGNAFQHQVKWFSQGERYILGKETKALPLILVEPPTQTPASPGYTYTKRSK
jgi:hypothetical protein